MKKNIAVVGGGNSSEFVISVKSAAQISGMMDKEKYNAFVISLKGDEWIVLGDEYNNAPIDKSDFSFMHQGHKITFDCAYITIHGTPGEDGILPAYFDLIGLPHSTCEMSVSSLTFDKYFCKTVLKDKGVRSAPSLLIKARDNYSTAEIVKTLGLPVFVKPTNAGSSFGVTKVSREEDLEQAINLAFDEDDHDVLIETMIVGTEITCGMVTATEQKIVFPLTEIVSENEFFDYAAKYEGKSSEITPARLSEEATLQCQNLTAYINHAINCKGITRTDYIYSEGEFYFIEINTIPGMSAASIVPQQVRTMGLEMKDIFSMVIEDTIGRKRRGYGEK